MQDKFISPQGNDEQTLSPRTQRIVEHLTQQLQSTTDFSFNGLLQSITALPVRYRTALIRVIAERLVNTMQLHFFLDIIPCFIENAANEDIDKEELSATLDDREIIDSISQLLDLNQQLTVPSIDTLLKVERITSGLLHLTAVTTAYDAQRWMYQFKTTYQDNLRREGLLQPSTTFSVSSTIDGGAAHSLEKLSQKLRDNWTTQSQSHEGDQKPASTDHDQNNKILFFPAPKNTIDATLEVSQAL